MMPRRKHRMVPTDQMVQTDQFVQVSLFGDQPLAMGDSSSSGHASQSENSDDYWARALGKATPPVAPPPAGIRRRSNKTAPRSAEAEHETGKAPASYWDRARGVAPRRPSPQERPIVRTPNAAVDVAPVLQGSGATKGEAEFVSAPLVASAPVSAPTESLATGEPLAAVRGAHARKEDPLAAEVRGAHVKADDPLAGAAWETQLTDDDALADVVRGVHVKTDDPLAAKFRPAHAPKTGDPVEESEIEGAEAAAEAVRAKTRRRRLGLLPVTGATAALVAGLSRRGA